MSLLALTAAYWLHMAATVVWVGGLFFQAGVLHPALDGSSTNDQALHLLRRVRTRFQPLSWLSLAVLIGTGLMQMSASPNYQGLLGLGNRWAAAIFAKHVAIVLMVIFAGVQTWVLHPRLERSLMAHTRQGDFDRDTAQLDARITNLNLILALVVLGLTAVARTA